MIRSTALFGLVCALLLIGPTAQAHNGDDHGAAPATTAVGAGLSTVSAATEFFEAVLKTPEIRSGQPVTGTLYLSDFATNAPVVGATVTLLAPGASGTDPTVIATSEPGIYALKIPGGYPADGHYDLTLSISAAGQGDLIVLGGLSIGPLAAAPVPVEHAHGSFPWGIVLGAAGLLLIGLIVYLRRAGYRLTRRPEPTIEDAR